MIPPELNPTHMVFRIPELVALIVDELRSDSQTLGRLARVSSAFHNLSIKYLWSKPGEMLDSVLQILPEGAFKPLHINNSSNWERKVVTESEWSRVRHYSFHITAMSIDTSLYYPSSMALLGERNDSHDSMLFPHLNTLKVSSANLIDYLESKWILLAGPSLQVLHVSGDMLDKSDIPWDMDLPFTSFCQDLVRRAPNIQDLRMTTFPNTSYSFPRHLIAEFCLCLRSLTSLQVIRLHMRWSIPSQLAFCIATLPSITELGLSMMRDQYSRLENNTRVFNMLQSLDLTGHGDAVGNYMQMIPQPQLLKKIRCTFYNGTLPSPAGLLSLSWLFKCATQLTSVNLGSTGLTWGGIQPLLCVSSIDTFSIHPPVNDLGDRALADLARAWRDLKRLEIYGEMPSLPYSISLLGLAPLAEFCPSLAFLRIEFTTRTTESQGPIRFEGGSGAIGNPQRMGGFLLSLNVSYSEITERDDDENFLGPRRTADILATMWPSLKRPGATMRSSWNLNSWSPHRSSQSLRTLRVAWRKVNTMLKESGD